MTIPPNPAPHLVGVDAALARQARHRGTGLQAQRNQLRLRRLVVHAAPVALVSNHQSAFEAFQIVCHYVPTFIYVGRRLSVHSLGLKDEVHWPLTESAC